MEWERGVFCILFFLMSLCACAIYACLLYTFYYLMMLLRGRGSKGKEDGRVLPYRAAAGILHIMALFFFSFPFLINSSSAVWAIRSIQKSDAMASS